MLLVSILAFQAFFRVVPIKRLPLDPSSTFSLALNPVSILICTFLKSSQSKSLPET